MQMDFTKMGPCQLSHGHHTHMQILLIGAELFIETWDALYSRFTFFTFYFVLRYFKILSYF